MRRSIFREARWRTYEIFEGGPLQLIVRTVTEQVYGAVRDRTLSGQIAPETPVRQDAGGDKRSAPERGRDKVSKPTRAASS